MKKYVYMIFVAFALSGCHIYRAYHRPDSIKVPDSFRMPDSVACTSADTATIASLAWQEVFTDPLLQELISYGLENNNDMLAAIEKVKEAKAALMTSKLSFLPSLTLAPQGGVSSFDHSAPSWTYNASVSASWEIDLFGKLMNAKRQAKVAMLQNMEYRQAVRTQLIATIADYYYTLVSLDEQLAIYEETERNWKSSVETIKAMKEGGMADEAAVSQSEANYYMVVASIPDIKASIIQQENALCVLLGNTPGVIRRGTLSQQKMEIPVEAGIPLQLLANRPDVRSAEYQLAGMYYSTNQARASFYPQISIGGSAGWTNSVGSVIVNPGKLLLSALASITQPLFYRGSNIAKLKIAKAQEEQARLNFQQTLLNAGQEVSDALVIYEAAEKKRDAREKQIDALYRSVESTTELMRLGSSTYLEVLTAQQSLLSAQITATQDRLSQLQAVVSLYHALGGGRDTTPENDSSQYKNK